VKQALAGLLQAWLDRVMERTGSLPRQDYDPQWPSPCQVGEPDAQGMILWRPVERDPPADFSGLERALEVPIHPDLQAWYGCFWCDTFEVRAEEGGVSLLQVWNQDDFDRLLGNLIGHALAKRRSRDPLTLFFACTDQDDYFLSLENHSGRVLLERPGAPPVKQVADGLTEFLQRLRPE
jgi:SecY interacting protein Syd